MELFSEPLHMGNVINSAGNEMTPFLAADGKRCISSNGLCGIGNQGRVYVATAG